MSTRLILGIDEAGYGPLLGPLVVSACAVRAPESAHPEGRDLWSLLRAGVVKPRKVARKPPGAGNGRARRRVDRRLVIGDSKLVYTTAAGPTQLERSVLSVAAWAAGRSHGCVDELLADVLPPPGHAALVDPWLGAEHGRFPLSDMTRVPVSPLVTAAAGVDALLLEARVLSAAQLNDAYRQTPNKADVAWTLVAELLRRGWERAGDEPAWAVVDRQGGRKQYAAGLERTFPGAFVWTLEERSQVSSYRVQQGGRTLEVTFRVAADRTSWPVAVASLLSKYVRELLMARLNGFFVHHGVETRPTAGYYGDAHRFLDDTALLRRRLGIDDHRFVRTR